MRILNLYAGIGGNRKLWDDIHEVTAVEIDPKIAEIYQDLYPSDTVIIGDAHEYLRTHYIYFDYIWSSPPCVSHSIIKISKLCYQILSNLFFPIIYSKREGGVYNCE